MVAVPQLHHGSQLAGAHALWDRLPAELTVGSGSSAGDSQFLPKVSLDAAATSDPAGDAGAEANVPAAHGTGPVQGVEGQDLVDVDDRQAENLGHVLLSFGGDVTQLLLHQVKGGEQSRSPSGIDLEQGLQALPSLPGELETQRSSSPAIMLTDPKVGTMSAIWSPSRMLERAAMMGKQGGRQRTRQGRSLPSLTI